MAALTPSNLNLGNVARNIKQSVTDIGRGIKSIFTGKTPAEQQQAANERQFESVRVSTPTGTATKTLTSGNKPGTTQLVSSTQVSRTGHGYVSQPTSSLNEPSLAANVQGPTQVYNPGADILQPQQQTPKQFAQAVLLQQQSRMSDLVKPIGPSPTIKDKVVGVYNKLTEKEARDQAQLKQEQNIRAGLREKSFTQSGRGTIVQENKQYTANELEKLAGSGKISKETVINVLRERDNEKYGREYGYFIDSVLSQLKREGDQKVNQRVQEAEQKINEQKTILQQKIADGKLTVDEANKILKTNIENENTKLSSYVGGLNKDQQSTLDSQAEKWVKTRGAILDKESYKYLDKVSDKIQFDKNLNLIPVYASLFAGVGLATTAVLGAAAAVGGTTAAVTSGTLSTIGITGAAVTSYQTGKYIGTAIGTGTLTPTKIANVVIPLAASIAGAYAGSKIAAEPKVSEIELRNAIERSKIKQYTGKSITSESQINRLNIPQGQKIELIARLNAGETLREVKVKIVGNNAADKALIKKGLGDLQIRRIDKLTQEGKWIQTESFASVKASRGVFNFKENVLSKGSGVITKEGAIIESTTVTGKPNKAPSLTKPFPEKSPITSAVKTTDVIKAKALQKDIIRVIEGKSTTFTGESIKATKNKPITVEDLQRVSASQAKELTSTTKFAEIQKQTGGNIALEKIGKDEFLLGLEKIYKTKKGVAITERAIKPIEFDKVPSKVVKPVKIIEPTPADYAKNVKSFQDYFKSLKPEQIQELSKFYDYKKAPVDKPFGDYKLDSKQAGILRRKLDFINRVIEGEAAVENIPSTDLSTSIKSSLASSAKQFNINPRVSAYAGTGAYELTENVGGFRFKPTITGKAIAGIEPPTAEQNLRAKIVTIKPINQKVISDLLAEQDKIGNIFPVTKTSQPVNILQKVNQQQTPTPVVTTKQLQNQIQKLNQVSITRNIAPVIPNTILDFGFPNIPPGLWGKQRGQGSKEPKKKKKIKTPKITPAYTSDLLNAFFQTKPVNVTRKQFQKLSKRTYTGLESRPVLNIVDTDIDLQKQIKKALSI